MWNKLLVGSVVVVIVAWVLVKAPLITQVTNASAKGFASAVTALNPQ